MPPNRARRRGRIAVQIVATLAIGALAVLAGVYVLPRLSSVEADERGAPSVARSPSDPASPSLPVPAGPLPGGAAQSAAPTGSPTASPSPSPTARVGRPSDALAAWARGLSRLGIPQVALQAYGYTEMVLARSQPGCRLSWTMLAGIGAVESNHGRYGGAVLRPDGTTTPRIVGIPLDGTRSLRIPDTDGGRLDGNRQFDQAMGPMQFIPSTWTRWATDADGDRNTDPYDIDDAALTAGRYLCANGRNLATGRDWWSAALSYNNVPRYASDVYARADRYGRSSLGI